MLRGVLCSRLGWLAALQVIDCLLIIGGLEHPVNLSTGCRRAVAFPFFRFFPDFFDFRPDMGYSCTGSAPPRGGRCPQYQLGRYDDSSP